MDTNDYYALLAPLFLLLMALEAWAGKRQGLRTYVLPDTLANLSCGLGQVLLGIFTGGFLLALYDSFGQTFSLVTWSEGSWVPWVLAFVGVDFCYYWFHRGSHAVHLFWAIHEVHHQSEEMNISVALRQPWFSDFTALIFFWPLPLLGVPRDPFFVAVACLSLYEAAMHTRVVSRTGLWGRLFNTPSYHRLHHARNAPYLDRNFGSTLIVWDRLFGTFVRETQRPDYGCLRRLPTWNPLRAQLQPILALLDDVRRVRGWKSRLKVFFTAPDYASTNNEAPVETPVGGKRDVPWRISAYALFQYVLTGALAFGLLWQQAALALALSAAVVLFLLTTTGIIGALFDGRSWAFPVELCRVALVGGAGATLAGSAGSAPLGWVALSLAGASFIWLLGLRPLLAQHSAQMPPLTGKTFPLT